MNEFCIEWIKGNGYAGVSAPSGTALKSKLMKYAEERPDEVKVMAVFLKNSERLLEKDSGKCGKIKRRRDDLSIK